MERESETERGLDVNDEEQIGNRKTWYRYITQLPNKPVVSPGCKSAELTDRTGGWGAYCRVSRAVSQWEEVDEEWSAVIRWRAWPLL